MSAEPEKNDAAAAAASGNATRLPGLYGNATLSSRVTAFQDKVDSHKEKQKTNPFSGNFDAVAAAKQKLSKDDPNYGKPVEGSKTDQRGKQAAQLVRDEIKLLLEVIEKHGTEVERDGKKTMFMKFKELFELYKVISNKVVGILLRARKYSLVQFEGEMLYQGRDDAVEIVLNPDLKLDDVNFEQ